MPEVYKKVEKYRGTIIHFNEYLKEYHTHVIERCKPYISVPIKSQDLDDLKKQIDDVGG